MVRLVYLIQILFLHLVAAVFQHAVKASGAITKVVSKLENEDANVRAATLIALQKFGKHGSSFESLYDLYI